MKYLLRFRKEKFANAVPVDPVRLKAGHYRNDTMSFG
jgi:hypothetical protein